MGTKWSRLQCVHIQSVGRKMKRKKKIGTHIESLHSCGAGPDVSIQQYILSYFTFTVRTNEHKYMRESAYISVSACYAIRTNSSICSSHIKKRYINKKAKAKKEKKEKKIVQKRTNFLLDCKLTKCAKLFADAALRRY